MRLTSLELHMESKAFRKTVEDVFKKKFLVRQENTLHSQNISKNRNQTETRTN